MTIHPLRPRGTLLVMALAAALTCTAFGAEPAGPGKVKILIAAEKTEFKDALVAKIKEGLTKRSLDFAVIDVSDLPAQKTDEYRAVVILNTVFALRPRHGARKFLSDLPKEQKGKVVMVSTARDPKWQTTEEGIHAITSASVPSRVADVSDFVLQQVDAIVKTP
jgi:hypothetical protein